VTETATPEVIFCPEEISRELGSDGQIVFVSDVHLTGGGPFADFDATTELVELLTKLAAAAAATEDPLGSQRWAGPPTASAGSAGVAPDEPAR
jgi:hypothetical protein